MKTSYEQVKEDVGDAWGEMGPILLGSIAIFFWHITLPIALLLGIGWCIRKMYASWTTSYKQKEQQRRIRLGYDK
tara:strand:+ start:734 stop:958 length:225 start_codon:yes stop_codon:yes gene_type:complete